MGTPIQAVPTQLFVDGRWMDSSAGATFDVFDPATGQTLASVADATAEDGARALNAAVSAQAAWAATAPRYRSNILRKAFDLLQERSEEFAHVMTMEMGKPIAEARAEVTYGGEFLRWFSEEAVRISGRYGSNPEGTGRMLVTHLPVGPCYFITPWNFPLAMATRKVGPALAAGCTTVLKPAALTPLTSLLFAQLMSDAGLPAGVLNVIPTSQSRAVSTPIIADRRLRKLSFTGSTEVGVALLKQAADNVLRTSMELGGNAPFIVFDDADVDAAVDGAMLAKFRNIGEACTAANRFLVHESVAEDFSAKLSKRVAALPVGAGIDPDTRIGPLIDANAVKKVGGLVVDAVSRGATVLTGGTAIESAGTFYAPTVITGVTPGSDILIEEIFGPVLAISTFVDEGDALARANSTEFGLASYVYTRDLARAQRMIESLDAGMMGLNTGAISNAAAPFGGVKQSGTGREGGPEGVHEFLEVKYVVTPDPFT